MKLLFWCSRCKINPIKNHILQLCSKGLSVIAVYKFTCLFIPSFSSAYGDMFAVKMFKFRVLLHGFWIDIERRWWLPNLQLKTWNYEVEHEVGKQQFSANKGVYL